MNARDSILARLRAAPAGDPAPLPDVAGWYAAMPRLDAAERLARFKAAIEASHAEVHETYRSLWPDLLLSIAEQKGLRRFLVGGTPEAALLRSRRGALDFIDYEHAGIDWRDEMFANVDASLTNARCALADTGSLVLWPDSREPRMMSLVPPVHFVLLDASAIHQHLYEAMNKEGWADGMPTNAVVISGPSKTADIQQTLAYGAHGPKEVVVLLCRENQE